jgi:hypothetical protein
MTHVTESRLHDYLDGLLADSERARIETHMHACADCRTELDALAQLVSEIGALPSEIPPAHDLRSTIARRLEITQVLDAGARVPPASDHEQGARPKTARATGSPTVSRHVLAAAAVVLLVLLSVFTLVVQRSGEEDRGRPILALDDEASLLEFQHAETRYLAAIAELETVLRQGREPLAAETLELLEENLAVLDRAIRETRAALAADTSQVELTRFIMASYAQKLDLLRRAQRFSS